jgi:hypothetical protein
VIEGVTLAVVLALAIAVLNVTGVIAGAAGMLVARVAANVYLDACERRSRLGTRAMRDSH